MHVEDEFGDLHLGKSMNIDSTQPSKKSPRPITTDTPSKWQVVETAYSCSLRDQLQQEKTHSNTRIRKLRQEATDHRKTLTILQETLAQKNGLFQAYEQRLQTGFQETLQRQEEIHKAEIQERDRAAQLRKKDQDIMNLMLKIQKLHAQKEDEIATFQQKHS
ncbi:hypothetical protein K439DRAFT_1618330 [Ramaria rubella]|nr:hypothetical protein K439DRAFT_1618330 [Ramaria rubella]